MAPERNREAMDDDALIAAVARGDDVALRELFQRNAPWLAGRLRGVLPAADVEDVLQETFLAVWRGAGGYRPGSAGGWLWGIARRQAALWLRRRGPEGLPLAALAGHGGQGAGDPAEAALSRAELAEAVRALGPEGSAAQEVWRLMHLEDRTVTEVAGLMGVPKGTVKSRAHRVRQLRRRLGYLPQSLGYYPGFTVAEFVEYFALLKEMPPGRVPQAVATAIERVDLGGRARAKLRTLSGGMLRRAGIAQAIVNEPELLLLDEPTAGLDPEQRVAFRALLRDLGGQATVIVSTHLVEDIGAACTEVALMDAGKIVFRGTPAELTARGEGTGAAGDAPLERGYSAVLAAARAATAAA
jgi:ABC-2 type transport system ATP-binding protein